MGVERTVAGVLWGGVVLLVAIGVTAAVNRAAFPADAVTRVDHRREQLLKALRRDDPFAADRPAELDRLDGRYAAHPVLIVLHVVPGAVFLALAPLQFSSRLRRRHIRVHRWSGRLLVLVAFVATLPALFFGLLMPYGGPGEAIAIGLFGGLFLLALTTAWLAIRRGQAARHREWMIRAFAVALAISTVRLVGAVADITLTPAGVRPRAVFVVSVWIGWAITLAAAEWWIRYTRVNPQPGAAGDRCRGTAEPFAARAR
jgi:uncharacterized membrane protein